ncbi:MAG: preprotein translocase, SecA subunit [Candidatus Taylorbacteria bacterium]|nr:preprotein translocase, SecA subunit [Candidatus Taylorbacteria bacterium]
MAFSLKTIFGDPNKKNLKKYESLPAQVNALESIVSALSDQDLKGKTATFKRRLSEAKNLEDEKKVLAEILPEAFAVVREAAKRTLGQRHFDVQLIGGAILHNGNIAEMRTGEGKTLVATLPVYLNALTGKGVHVITVNDYLSRRDAVWMGQIYNFLGISTAVINHDSSYVYDPEHKAAVAAAAPAKEGDELDKVRDLTGSFHVVHEFLRPVSRRDAYLADITYGTNNEFGFDYLRDNLEYNSANIRQREFNYAVVDEIDSILIDEARTPLIISSPTTDSENLYQQFAEMARGFIAEEDFTVDEKRKQISLTDKGIEKAEKILNVGNIYTDKGIKYVHHLETAVRAKALFNLNKEYVIKEGQIVIVDEFTGRLQPGRRWSEGLHQAIEAKEGVPVQKESRTFASITFQNYFRLYRKLSGMTGTAVTSAEEFYKVYGLETITVPTHHAVQRIDRNDLIFQTEKGKYKAVARKVKELNKKGQPVLVGTVSIEKNEVLSQFLKAEGVPHEVLNAKNHEREGEIIAQAGKKGAVTIATNMAGRGVDIKLGGNPGSKDLYEEVKSVGGLFVLGTERHDARRIDNQLRGRAGRQGDPGETQFFVSLDDSLMRIFAGDTIKNLMGRLGVAEDEPIENRIITRSLESAQSKIEGLNFDSRKHVLEYDDVLNHQRKTVYERRRKIVMGTIDEVAAKLDEVVALADADTKALIEKSIADKIAQLGRDVFYGVARQVMLQTIDMFWVEHLEVMDYTRSSVNLRAYGQRDPLVEYKKEGLRLFKEMNEAVNGQILGLIQHVGAQVAAPQQVELKEVHEGAAKAIESSNAAGGDGEAAGNRHARRAMKKAQK